MYARACWHKPARVHLWRSLVWLKSGSALEGRVFRTMNFSGLDNSSDVGGDASVGRSAGHVPCGSMCKFCGKKDTDRNPFTFQRDSRPMMPWRRKFGVECGVCPYFIDNDEEYKHIARSDLVEELKDWTWYLCFLFRVVHVGATQFWTLEFRAPESHSSVPRGISGLAPDIVNSIYKLHGVNDVRGSFEIGLLVVQTWELGVLCSRVQTWVAPK